MSRRPGFQRQKILVQHWRWLEQQGPSYKQQAASCKRQAASLTRLNYRSIKEIRPAGWQLKLDEARRSPVSGSVPWQHGRHQKERRNYENK